MEFKLDDSQKKTAIVAGAAVVGAGQTIILRKYGGDFANKPIIAQLGEYGKLPAFAGIAGGSLALLLSVFVLKDHQHAHALAAYGGTALISGVLAGAGII